MNNFIKTALIAGAAIAFGSAPARANHSWGGYHWARTANPVTLRINTALTGNWAGYASTAIGQWDQSQVLAFTTPKLNPVNASAKRCDPISGQVLVCNAGYGQRGWLGIASIWANGTHITQATTKLNDTYFAMARYNTDEWRAMVTCQEIGHDFGLGHQNEDFNNLNVGSCMDYTNDPTGRAGTNGPLANIAPNQHDYEMLASIYAHLDSTNTSTSSATNFGIRQLGKPTEQPSGDRGAGDTMAEWGRAIHQDGKGRPDVFIRQLPDGRQVLTHVFWAPDANGTEAE
ncbi:MAG: hypothetical protein ABIQ32_01405 [Sphingomicrobium sp.]